MNQPPDFPWRRREDAEGVHRPRHRSDDETGAMTAPSEPQPSHASRPEVRDTDALQPQQGGFGLDSAGMPPTPSRTQAKPGVAAPVTRRPPRRSARRSVVLRKVDPWSVLKLSLIFYFCVLLVVMLALTVFWGVVNRIGVIDQILDFLADLQLIVTIDGGMIARAIFLIGLLNVILWSGINVFLAFLYNLIADLVGGLRVSVVDDE